MKKLSIVLWLGLIIDLLFIGGFFYYVQLQQTDLNSLTYQDQEALKEFYPIAKLAAIAIAIQIVSVLLLFVHKNLALFLAMLSGCITLPLGCMYIIGFLMSYNNFRFAELQTFNSVNRKQLSSYLCFRQERFYITTVILGVAAFFQFSISTSPMWILLVVAAIASAFNGIRLTNRPVLGIYGDQLVITPSPFSKTYQVSSKQVTMKKKGKNTISFLIQTDSLKETVKIKRNLIKTTDDAGIDEIEEIEKKLTKQGSL
ncbi:hypothetical protein AM629_18835 [Photorhabdus heterorhabditis]|uniref:Uncharacterized protein n=1 Tax=Photorhabdus heterorhabditis TaxID=880156 RepID=A0ABR5K7E4_9GAMM|nr:hypothetical protein [Photorhabdus heterorhabditis]KOY60520.1 hypothetical protein AM629_18835 [Photorhabdus heterorhabditis]